MNTTLELTSNHFYFIYGTFTLYCVLFKKLPIHKMALIVVNYLLYIT